MFKFFNKQKTELPKDAKIIEVTDVPLDENGQPDIAAILAANGITDVDLSKVQVMKVDK